MPLIVIHRACRDLFILGQNWKSKQKGIYVFQTKFLGNSNYIRLLITAGDWRSNTTEWLHESDITNSNSVNTISRFPASRIVFYTLSLRWIKTSIIQRENTGIPQPYGALLKVCCECSTKSHFVSIAFFKFNLISFILLSLSPHPIELILLLSELTIA